MKDKIHWSRPLFGIGLIGIALAGGYFASNEETLIRVSLTLLSFSIIGLAYGVLSIMAIMKLEGQVED